MKHVVAGTVCKLCILSLVVTILCAIVVPVKGEAPTVSFNIERVNGVEVGDSIWGEFQVLAYVSSDVIRAEFCIDQTLKETRSNLSKPFALWFGFTTADYPAGKHVLEVKVYDASGDMGSFQATILFDPSTGELPLWWFVVFFGVVVALAIILDKMNIYRDIFMRYRP